MDTGLKQVRSTAEASGLLPSSFGPPVPAFAMGNSTPSAIRMADAYGTFAAHGIHMDPYSVRKVTRNGEPVRLDLPRPGRAMRSDVADEVTASLAVSTGRKGAASPPRSPPRPAPPRTTPRAGTSDTARPRPPLSWSTAWT